MTEQWRDVSGFEGLYQVSSHGRVKRLAGTRNAGKGTVAKVPERVWHGYIDTQGYYSVGLGKTKKSTVHRLVCKAFHGDPPAGRKCVAHHDGNKLNNNAENLRWVTHLENSEDGRRLGRLSINEKAWKARLTKEDVQSIRREYASMNGKRGAINQIAVRRGLGRNHVRQIVRRLLWNNIT